MGGPGLALLSSVAGNVSVGDECLMWTPQQSKLNVKHIATKKANTILMINFDPNDKFLAWHNPAGCFPSPNFWV